MSLLLIANRAPIRQAADGSWTAGLGGLASALLPVLTEHGGAWVSMRGPEEEAPEIQHYPGSDPAFTVRRVPLDPEEHTAYYQGMANQVLWPLCHYLIDNIQPERGYRDAYRAVNRRFAHTALEQARREGVRRFWVQDYHLMHVPQMIRAGMPEAEIGQFWHIPWPAPEVFCILPSAKRLLRGMLGADLHGFHTEGDAENFRESARDLLGAEVEGEVVYWEGRQVRAEAHPIGIDVGRFEELATRKEVPAAVEALREEMGTEKIVLGVDRLDYTKGLLLRLDAFERFLELHPEWQGRVTLFQVATPSRTGIPAYDRLKRDVDEHVGRINGRFAEGNWVPIRYRYRSYQQEELAALYRAADVAYVTPLRDGMNLVAQEFTAVTESGMLVLSALAGAADYLDGALLVNPYDADGLARVLHRALEMEESERRERMTVCKKAVRGLNVHGWAQRFLDSLGPGGTTSPEGALPEGHDAEQTEASMPAATDIR